MLALETALTIKVKRLPTGRCKWNKIEHRLLSHIAMNWRGRPLFWVRTIGVRLLWNDGHLTNLRTGLAPRSAIAGGFSSAYLEA